jgi:hypothetical protein
MIYIHRDWSKVPPELLQKLHDLTHALDTIDDPAERKEFIKDNANAWAALREHLSAMSHNKCWYSEAREVVSRYQVDHFRPHGRAKQAAGDLSDGYSWLAFDPDNFRLAGVLCNTINKEYSEESVGKGDWFPLENPNERACWVNRGVAKELPILLDPTDGEDASALVFSEGGAIDVKSDLGDEHKERVRFAIRCLGLDQSLLKSERNKTWRECVRKVVQYSRFAGKPKGQRTNDEYVTMKEIAADLIKMTKAESEFSAVARSCLVANKLEDFICRNELEPIVDSV